jgi:hypothetical protein
MLCTFTELGLAHHSPHERPDLRFDIPLITRGKATKRRHLLDIQISNFQGMFLNKVPAGLYFITH